MNYWRITIDQQTRNGLHRYGPYEIKDELLPLAVVEAIDQARLHGAIAGAYQITVEPQGANAL